MVFTIVIVYNFLYPVLMIALYLYIYIKLLTYWNSSMLLLKYINLTFHITCDGNIMYKKIVTKNFPFNTLQHIIKKQEIYKKKIITK